MMLFILGIIICVTIIAVSGYRYLKLYNIDMANIDKDTNDISVNQLNELIKLETTYEVNARTGKAYNESLSAKLQLSVAEMEELISDITIKIIGLLDGKTKDFLFNTYGSNYILEYVKINVCYIVMNQVAEREIEDSK